MAEDEELTQAQRAGQEVLESIAGRLVTQRTFEEARDATRAHVAALEREIDTMRVLSRYNRRTWFYVMATLVVGVVCLGDIRSHYATGWYWDLLFWAAPHGGGGWPEHAAQILGFLSQAVWLTILILRAQVPGWLELRVPHGAPNLEAYVDKYEVDVSVNPRWFESPPWCWFLAR